MNGISKPKQMEQYLKKYLKDIRNDLKRLN